MYLMAPFATSPPNSDTTPRRSREDFMTIYIFLYKVNHI
jgi:hypothetical protein